MKLYEQGGHVDYCPECGEGPRKLCGECSMCRECCDCIDLEDDG